MFSFLRDEPVSTIHNDLTTLAATIVFGIRVAPALDHRQIRMEPGEIALVIRLTQRLSDSSLKRLPVAKIASAMELGLLERRS